MSLSQPRNPLHGVTLEQMLRELVAEFGWEGLARDVPVKCFLVEPSINSALKYLRKATRHRAQVEQVYLAHLRKQGRA
ncbi:MAG: hypothetical protein RL760_1556 [Candidatus Eisenbacteria bacterium]|jgi:uncharacterized protein (DUF2132 family)